MKIEEQTKQFITITEEHKMAFEHLCRNIVKGQIKFFDNNCIYIEPNYNVGYTNSIQVKRVEFKDNMEIKHILFDKDNSSFNKMFKEIIPFNFYKDNHITDIFYRINFVIKEPDIFLSVVFNKYCNISKFDASYKQNNDYSYIDVVIEGFQLDEITKKEEKKKGLFERIFG